MRTLLRPWRSLTRSPIRRGLSLACVALSVVCWLTFAPTALGGSYNYVTTYGTSMEPTLQSWELCLSLLVHHYQPERGEIVTFRTADDPPLYLVKRVLGLPGETVAIERGVVQINGQPLPEPYARMPRLRPWPIRLVLYRMVWHGRWRR